MPEKLNAVWLFMGLNDTDFPTRLTLKLSGAPLLRVRLERQVSEVIGLSAARRMEETGGGCFDLAIIPRLLKNMRFFNCLGCVS